MGMFWIRISFARQACDMKCLGCEMSILSCREDRPYTEVGHIKA